MSDNVHCHSSFLFSITSVTDIIGLSNIIRRSNDEL